QVVIGCCGDAALMRRHLDGKDGKYTHLPNAALLFPDLLEPDTTPAPSCADAIAAREQSLFVNDWVALAAAQMLYKLLYRVPIHHFLTYVSSDGMSVRSVPIKKDELSVYLGERTS
ncbi:MAG: hypothetical protein SF123_24410, partial [Chloroflexota bacterium]|nr:hypothetical protein [Chloroflexota bacterium]